MNPFTVFISGDYFCSICLKTPDKARLLYVKNAAFFTAIEIFPETQWICSWCSARMNHFYDLRSRAQQSQQLLAIIRMGAIYQTKEKYQEELKEIQKEKYECIYFPAEITNTSSLHVVSDENEIKNSTAEEKTSDTKPEYSGQFLNRHDLKSQKQQIFSNDQPKDIGFSMRFTPVEENYDKSVHLENVNLFVLDLEPKIEPSLHSEGTHDLWVDPLQSANTLESIRDSGKRSAKYFNHPGRAEMLRKEFNSGKKEITLSEEDNIIYALSDLIRRHVCQTRYTEEQLSEVHLEALQRAKYKDSKYKCELCASGFATKATYDRHMKKHSTSSGKFKCGICETFHKSRSLIGSHVASHYRLFACNVCGHRSTTLQHATNHYFIQHAGVRLHCAHCSKSYKSPNYLKKHFMVHERVYGPLETSTCEVCQKIYHTSTTTQKYRFTNHVRSHAEGKKTFLCTVCDKVIVASRRSNHMKLHAALMACKVCHKMFSRRESLKIHMDRIHSRAKKYQCDTCGKLFFGKSEVRIHIEWTHLKLGGVVCSVCEMKFRKPYLMRQHVSRVHENTPKPKNILCDICGTGFSTRVIMEHHRLIHTGDKPHKCEHCGTTFRQKCAMKTHVKLKHMNIKWSDLVAERKKKKEGAENIVE